MGVVVGYILGMKILMIDAIFLEMGGSEVIGRG